MSGDRVPQQRGPTPSRDARQPEDPALIVRERGSAPAKPWSAALADVGGDLAASAWFAEMARPRPSSRLSGRRWDRPHFQARVVDECRAGYSTA